MFYALMALADASLYVFDHVTDTLVFLVRKFVMASMGTEHPGGCGCIAHIASMVVVGA